MFFTTKKRKRKKKRALLWSITTPWQFREKPWGFCRKVNSNLPAILHLGLDAQLSPLTQSHPFNLSVFRPTCHFLHVLYVPSWNSWEVFHKVVQLPLVFCPSKFIEIFSCYSFLCFYIAITKEHWNQEDPNICVYSFLVLNLKPSLLFKYLLENLYSWG